jgi:hypothetical protein
VEMYVEPELRRLFQTATQTVGADLEQLNGNEKTLANRTLRIPTKHADAWLSALESGPARHRCKKQFYRAGTEATTFTHRLDPAAT